MNLIRNAVFALLLFSSGVEASKLRRHPLSLHFEKNEKDLSIREGFEKIRDKTAQVDQRHIAVQKDVTNFADKNEKLEICHIPPGNNGNFKTKKISSNAWPAHFDHGDLYGSCEANCFDLCSDGDFCTNDVQEDKEKCTCNYDHPLVPLKQGEKCCAPLGSIIPEEACCPVGDPICCGLSAEECLGKLLPFQFELQLKVFGEPEPGADEPIIPLFKIENLEPIRQEVTGTFKAATLNGRPFEFEILEILKTSAELTAEAEQPSIPQELVDLIANLTEPEQYDEVIAELEEPTTTEVLQAFVDTQDVSTLVLGSINGTNYFVALVNTYVDPTGRMTGYLHLIDDPELYDILPPAVTRRSRNLQSSCADAFAQAEAAFPCPDGGDLTTDPICRAGLIGACETDVQQAREAFEKAKKRAEQAKKAGEAALLLWKAKTYRDVVVSCRVLIVPKAIAACIAAGIAFIELRSLAIKKALEKAFEEAIEIALNNLDVLLRAAYALVKAGADACFDCCPDDECCPPCEGTDFCCDGTCVAEDACCPVCTGDQTCCEGRCFGPDACCPACTVGQQCCEGSCIGSEECCNDDPCCESDDPCCGNDDPCCGSEDPCCGSRDPCCGSSSCGGSSGDPHMTTFDGLRYDCQGRGDFILTKSGDMQVQGRFKKLGRVALTTAVAVTDGLDGPIVEITIPVEGGGPLLRIDGVPQPDPSLGFENNHTIVTDTGGVGTGPFRVVYKASSLTVYVQVFGSRYMNVRVGLPELFKNQGTVGLMGSADGNSANDWMEPDGSLVPIPTSRSGRIGLESLTYCTTNWCISEEVDSLFTYDETYDFAFFSGCDDGSSGVVDLNEASAQLQQLCGADEACLIDGIVLGDEAAQDLLDEQAALAAAVLTAEFRFDPATVTVGVAYNVAITVDLSRSALTPGTIDEFVIYRVDPITGQQGSTPILRLHDDGSGADTVAGDLIFANFLAVLSNSAGEEYGFRAIPVIAGAEDPSSTLVFTSLNAIRSFSSQSGIGDDANTCNCDDGDPCTIDACDARNVCQFEPVACGIDEVCDSFTGRCENIQNLVPCVAIIDEWDDRNYATQWSTFRRDYPKRPFCLLVPNTLIQTLPNDFDADNLSPDGIDRTIAVTVNRDNGNVASVSDWFTICELDKLSPSSIGFVGLFIDTSGSMTLNTVLASRNEFLADVEAAGLEIAQVFNGSERWIDPFLTTLVPAN